jgi:multiple sugar transport system substrate-binding protein
VPEIENEGGRWALGLLRSFYADGLVPRELPGWHYDRVHEYFREGSAAMVGDWPGYYGLYRDPGVSKVHDRFAVARYPIGPSGRSTSYGGGHTFALTPRGVEKPEALALLLHLTSPEQQMLEARNGCIPVRRSVMWRMKEEADDANRARLALLERVIAEDILVPPKFASYPRVEEVLWRTVQRAFVGDVSVDEALGEMRRKIERVVAGEPAATGEGSSEDG